MNCSKCNSLVRNEDINIQIDVAKCEKCSALFKISENIFSDEDVFTINETPLGAWVKKEFNPIIVGATTRSPIAIFLVTFMLYHLYLEITAIKRPFFISSAL